MQLFGVCLDGQILCIYSTDLWLCLLLTLCDPWFVVHPSKTIPKLTQCLAWLGYIYSGNSLLQPHLGPTKVAGSQRYLINLATQDMAELAGWWGWFYACHLETVLIVSEIYRQQSFYFENISNRVAYLELQNCLQSRLIIQLVNSITSLALVACPLSAGWDSDLY